MNQEKEENMVVRTDMVDEKVIIQKMKECGIENAEEITLYGLTEFVDKVIAEDNKEQLEKIEKFLDWYKDLVQTQLDSVNTKQGIINNIQVSVSINDREDEVEHYMKLLQIPREKAVILVDKMIKNLSDTQSRRKRKP